MANAIGIQSGFPADEMLRNVILSVLLSDSSS